jgi:hypothetical protein
MQSLQAARRRTHIPSRNMAPRELPIKPKFGEKQNADARRKYRPFS